MSQAFAYLRVSTVGQVQGHGFDRQLDTIQAYAREAGIEIIQVFKEEGISGTTDETQRPAFQELMAAVLGNGVRTIIVESMDRLARELRIQEALLVYLASKGVSLISARTAENITVAVQADPLKKALVQVQGVFAELEKNQLVRRLKKGRDKTRELTGRCEGRRPYGDTAEEQAVIRRIRAMRRKRRNGLKGMTLQSIADRLNAEGIRTRDGLLWRPVQIHRILTR
ncbi:MAG: recombinase family protein [Deltaproteobacteria bacterium]|nr:recombinase family protein [Deltaproteobacteria bacterium]